MAAHKHHNERFPLNKFSSYAEVSKDYTDKFLRKNHERLSKEGLFTLKDSKTGEILDVRSTNSAKRFARKRLYYAIRISMNTLLRPTNELSSCRWDQYEPKTSKKYPDITLALVTTHQAKRSNPKMRQDRERLAVGAYSSDLLFKTWRRICEDYGYGLEEDFILPKWTTQKEKESVDTSTKHQQMSFSEMGRTFSLLLRKWGQDKNPRGETITLYSSRHRAISDRIIGGQNILVIASAAGTSMGEIDRTYASIYAENEADLLANAFGDSIPKFDERYRNRLAKELALVNGAPQIAYQEKDPYAPEEISSLIE